MRLISFVLLFTSFAQADYRAYRLQILKDGQPVREVVEILDHIQYTEYYSLNTGETIEYVESWMCFGRFDDWTPPCSNPQGIAGETSNSQAPRSPATQP